MKFSLRVLMLVFLPACSRCTGEDLPPVSDAPTPAQTVAVREGGAPQGRTVHSPHHGDITIKSAATLTPPNPQFKRKTHN